MLLQCRHRRIALDLVARDHRLGEHRGFGDAQADIDADGDQQDAGQERHPPAPRHQLLSRQHGHEREGAGGHQVADRDAQRREAAPEAAMLGRCVLHQIDHRAAIFGAGAQALNDTQEDEQDRRPIADLRIGRQEADGGGADADHQQCRHQHGLAAIAVAHDAEEDAAQRPDHEADAEGQERQQRADQRVALREEEFAEHQRGGGAIEEEIIPFERRADAGGNDHAHRHPTGLLRRRSHGVSSCDFFLEASGVLAGFTQARLK